MNIIKFDAISKKYAELSKHDPSKEFVQRPAILKLLGKCKGKTVLDVGLARRNLI